MIRLLLFVILFLFTSSAFSQRYAFINYSTSEGLPQSQVNTITQDDDGYLWLGTLGGLAKFNGVEFTSYGKSDGLLNNRITHVEIINEQLYVGHDKGISYQCAIDSFCPINFPENVTSRDVTDIQFHKGGIYVATNGSGLFLLNKKKKSLSYVKDSPERIRSLVNYSNSLYLATRNGIVEFTDLFRPVESIPEGSYSSIVVQGNNLVFTSYDGILMRYSLISGEIEKLLEEGNTPFRNVTIDSHGNYWLNSKNGVTQLKKEKVLKFTEQTGLPINDVNIVFEDREKNIWFGTGGKGLLKFTGDVFTHFNEKSGLPSDLIISLLKDKDNKLWLSTYDKGICTIDNEGNVSTEPYVPSIVWNMEQTNDMILFGSNYGLHVYNYNNWTSYYEEQGLPSNRIKGLKRKKNGDIIVGTSEGTVIFDEKTGTFKSLNKQAESLKNVRDFIELNDTLLFAAQNGVYKIYNNTVKLIQTFDAGINCIEIDNNNLIWVGTENGLYIENNGFLTNYILEENGGADYINFIKKVDTVMFIGTNNGLYEITFDKKHLNHYDINAGLVDLETNLNSSYLDKNNNLWFGTAAGLMKMDLGNRNNLFYDVPPKIHLTDIEINFNKLSDEKIKQINTNLDENFLIEYKNNNIAFDFDGIYLSNPKALSYSYFLEGFSDAWSPSSSNPRVSFTNLSPGAYTLSFKASTSQGIDSKTYQISFEILPPFYRTWWFYLICFILLTLTVIFLDRIRVQRLDRKNYRLKLEFQNKLTRLEQQSLNASMNRHFIFNALNSIQYYINSSDKKSANKYLSRFAKLIRKNLDSSHQENGMVPLNDELERLELYLELETMRFNEKFSYSIEIGERVEIEMLKVPAMFLQPFVENSIIHGILPLKDRKGVVNIIITDHLDHIRIEIRDNGVGIENSVKNKKEAIGDHESQGMLITKGRIELLQKISARSIEMIGPIQINESSSSINGTLVTFKIIKQYLE
jgi:ligand-binding sensor domain-containing protein